MPPWVNPKMAGRFESRRTNVVATSFLKHEGWVDGGTYPTFTSSARLRFINLPLVVFGITFLLRNLPISFRRTTTPADGLAERK
ncbi:hypothetical protein CDAR_184881 [Caerostris darwini]|uniref:Uncharacterized protein n=1 Tax=Caerostris darwini TaxID=1538125 RepID=A0AAV4SNS1_9ARAC|nr:hypothetical protein CDAR_184881 [Caerostris darwini]